MLIGRGRVLIGGGRMLVGGGRTFLRRTDAGLGLFVNLFELVASVFDLLTVLGALLAYLVQLGLDGSRGIADVFFRRAAASE